jgi:hypothetical protein
MLNFISFYTTIIVLIIFINYMLRTVVGELVTMIQNKTNLWTGQTFISKNYKFD